MLKYENVDDLNFYTYLEDIKNQLLKHAPEWEVQYHEMPNTDDNDSAFKGYYNLGRWDFSKGKDQTWPIKMLQHIFAYTELDENRKPLNHYLLNSHPIQQA